MRFRSGGTTRKHTHMTDINHYEETPQQKRGFPLLGEQVEDLYEFAANPKQRVGFGLKELDNLVLGPAPGEVFTFVARSFVGKSLVATNVMANNPDEPILFFSLEMVAHQVLPRLYSHVFNTPSHDVGLSIRHNDLPSQFGELSVRLPKQVVVDKSNLTLESMTVYTDKFTTYYGEKPRLVIIDYLEEVGGAKSSGEGWTRTEATASAVKAWARDHGVGVLLLHQASQKTEPWEPVSSSSAKGGGYTEADVVIGGWRPGRNPDLNDTAAWQMRNHFYMNVLKNRVTGDLKGELRYTIDPAMKLVQLQPTLTAVQDAANVRIAK